MNFEIIFVLLCLVAMVVALINDRMRPGMVLFSVVVLFCARESFLRRSVSKDSPIKA